MKTFTTLCIVLFLFSAFYVGCKDDNTTSPKIETGVDFTITYSIIADTCYFYAAPSEDVKIDSLKSEYATANWSFVYINSDPEYRFVKGTAYWIEWWYNLTRPATWKFTFWGRKYSNNSSYTTVKSFTVP